MYKKLFQKFIARFNKATVENKFKNIILWRRQLFSHLNKHFAHASIHLLY